MTSVGNGTGVLKGKGPRVEDITLALLLVVRVKRRLAVAERLYKQCVEQTNAERRKTNLSRRKALRTAGKMRQVIFDIRRELRGKDVMLARLEHEAKIGRLLESSKNLEDLAKAYLSEGEWIAAMRWRNRYQKGQLKRKLREEAKLSYRRHHERDGEGRFAPRESTHEGTTEADTGTVRSDTGAGVPDGDR